MIKKLLFAALPALAMVGCLNDASEGTRAMESATESPGSSVALETLEAPVKLTVGSKSVTLYKSPDGGEILESSHPLGETPLLTPEMSGKTWKEITESIAPGSKVAPEYANVIYIGDIGQPKSEPGALAKSSMDAGIFEQNNCIEGNHYVFSWCMLNRSAPQFIGDAEDWGKHTARVSYSSIVVNSGSQVNFRIRINGSYVLTKEILGDNIVRSWSRSSPKDIFGLYKWTTHQYVIRNSDPAASWHWAARGW
jgi:hypothetical protein